MKKSSKVFWIIAAVVFVCGVVLATAGFFSGARLGMYINRDGFNFADADTARITLGEAELGSFDSIVIDADLGRVRVAAADTYGIDILSSADDLSYAVNDGELRITQKRDWKINIGLRGLIDEEIVVYCKTGESLDSVTINSGLGDVEVSDISADSIYIDTDMGKADIRNVAASSLTGILNMGNLIIRDSHAETLNVTNSMGLVEIYGVVSDDMDIDADMGGVAVEGDLGSARIDCNMGSVSFVTAKQETEYTYAFDVDLGNISVDRRDRVTGGGSYNGGNGRFSLDFSANMGSISVEFGE